MKNWVVMLAKPVVVFTTAVGITILFVLFSQPNPAKPDPMAARSFVLWLHGLGDSGPANEPIRTLFTSPEFKNTKWSFPSAPLNTVTCNQVRILGDLEMYCTPSDTLESLAYKDYNQIVKLDLYGAVMPSWFDIHEIPVTADSPNDENGLLKAVNNIHAMIDKEIAAGTNPNNVFVCGFSQGGALTLASVLLYPRSLGGGAVFSGWVPFNYSIQGRITAEAKRVITSDKTPILWSHGMLDITVLFEAGQSGPPFLEKAGLNCEFKAYPGLGHSISHEELKYLESWIKARLQSSS